jgi:ribosomal protein L32
MAVPKKKVSRSQKKKRFNSIYLKSNTYKECTKCFNFILLHRICFCETNLINTQKKTNIILKFK